MSGLYYYGSGVGPNVGAGCNYAQLGSYSLGFQGIRPPVPLTSVSGYQVVPAYSAPGYDTLTHGSSAGGTGGCKGGSYFQIEQAYGESGNCAATKYLGSICQ